MRYSVAMALSLAAALGVGGALYAFLVQCKSKKKSKACSSGSGILLSERMKAVRELIDDRLTTVQRTSRNGAGMRVAEMRLASQPVIQGDELAAVLAGPYGIALGELAFSACVEAEGPGKVYYWAARARIVDDHLLAALGRLQGAHPQAGRLQVVSLGTGMCTRPWRLALPPGVAWFDVDYPDVLGLKAQLLGQGDAQFREDVKPAKGSGYAYPLRCSSYTQVPCDLAQQHPALALAQALAAAGCARGVATLFVAEGLSYYVQLGALGAVLQDCASLAPGGLGLLLLTSASQAYHDAVVALGDPSWMFHNHVGMVTQPGWLPACGWRQVGLTKDFGRVLAEEYGRQAYSGVPYFLKVPAGSDVEYLLTAST